jgi:flagellar biosynthetic protein FlhB
MSDTADRTIPATPRRREAARREGTMPDAAPLAWAASAIVTVLLLPGWARATWPALTSLVATWFAAVGLPAPLDPRPAAALPIAVIWPSAGLVLAAAVVGLGVRLAVDGLSWRPARAAPDPARINPVRGLGRIISLRSVTIVVGNAAALALLVGVAVLSAGPWLAVAAAPPATLLGGFAVAWRTLVPLTVAAAVVAIAQYAAGRWRFERRLRMTPREFTEEARSLQADPRIRLLHQQRAGNPRPAPR